MEYEREKQSESRFALDTPAGSSVESVFRISGWYLDPDGKPASRIRILFNGRYIAVAASTTRMDVGAAYPQFPHAYRSGFVADVIVPSAERENFRIAVEFTTRSGMVDFIRINELFNAAAPDAISPAKKSFEWEKILVPSITDVPGITTDSTRGSIRFYHESYPPLVRLCESGYTHRYPSNVIDLIDNLRADQIYLDFGCGIRPADNKFENGVLLDAVQFNGVDVVNNLPRLPFRDKVFDLVFSMSVFEHLDDPANFAKEIFRVLKPGGIVYIETAFMQPLHGDPDHYFNMTESGIAKIFEDFSIDEIGSQQHQQPSDGLRMQIDAVRGFVTDATWRKKLDDLLDYLERDGRYFDDALGVAGRRVVAAGVYLLGRRPYNDKPLF